MMWYEIRCMDNILSNSDERLFIKGKGKGKGKDEGKGGNAVSDSEESSTYKGGKGGNTGKMSRPCKTYL